ncbi:MAG: hypothetical protein IPI01_10370 [Ignavibacteriae bacterium]|nr:hypothetical protein [Ignavibacteriota bacterium]
MLLLPPFETFTSAVPAVAVRNVGSAATTGSAIGVVRVPRIVPSLLN